MDMSVRGEGQSPAVLAEMNRYIPVIHGMLDERKMTLRDLAVRSQISKSRLGIILHRQPTKRVIMQLPEFIAILHALGFELVHAWAGAKKLESSDIVQDKSFNALYEFLVEFNVTFPEMMLNTPEMEGVEFRKEWSRPLAALLIQRVLHELERRRRARDEFALEDH
ncbi:hypothetical protein BV98_001336 [Sphingobium herbicidovorans NBRC 16415]|uniref:XRE family transcriptional regulator n=1 Tax=Sphingobium herbicidovorans (strain ATCC 700291 / DSM 11019 / CCUG 56400 / KCTC 2939 / LMG 18315 / NBRC 16415 / MH) TaxID=1219045 RepID=A0A086PBN7_SPHHM|nr:XRE family transcriptional regulator [Sphingobium herbicidovorans]KFG90805.1 hypothetical protein BV98_001336 [Sphingobium herbicidovorans NBRC 16415]